MNPARDETSAIEGIAARWLQLKADRSFTDAEADELALWLAQSHRHADVFERLSRAWSSEAVWTALAALADEERQPKPRRWRAWARGAGAGLSLAALALVVLYRPPAGSVFGAYATATAQLRTIELAEGSQLNLNGETQVSVRFDRRSRVIELTQGEISIKVAQERRPLQVVADGATITAVGTAFNVDRRDQEIAVFVQEGVVAVARGDLAPVRVAAGQAVRVTDAGIMSAPADFAAAAWAQGTVATSGMSIRDLAHALSRYTEKEIVVAPTIADEVVSGRFSLAQPERTLRLLAGAYDLQLVEERDRLVLQAAPE